MQSVKYFMGFYDLCGAFFFFDLSTHNVIIPHTT